MGLLEAHRERPALARTQVAAQALRLRAVGRLLQHAVVPAQVHPRGRAHGLTVERGGLDRHAQAHPVGSGLGHGSQGADDAQVLALQIGTELLRLLLQGAQASGGKRQAGRRQQGPEPGGAPPAPTRQLHHAPQQSRQSHRQVHRGGTQLRLLQLDKNTHHHPGAQGRAVPRPGYSGGLQHRDLVRWDDGVLHAQMLMPHESPAQRRAATARPVYHAEQTAPAGAALPFVLSYPRYPMSVYDKLSELNITLPPVSVPAAAYVPYVQTGNLVFLSGHIARKDGKPWAAQFGRDISTEEGKLAARSVAIDLMGTLQAACGGDLNRVKRIVKVMSLVNSTGDFTEQHLVTNGASELLGQVFGEAGVHARSAFGVAQIPLGACVEIELIAELG